MMDKTAVWAFERKSISSNLLLLIVICRLISSVGLNLNFNLKAATATNMKLSISVFEGRLEVDETEHASTDFGNMKRTLPSAVLHPASVNDISKMLKSVQRKSSPLHGLTVSARGHGHSVEGQCLATGVVINMASLKGIHVNPEASYVDVSGGVLWIDVLNATLNYGLAPRSWTDYLYLSVGGTLSNAGISGQAFRHGPQISNVRLMEVVTGSGKVVECSEEQNSDLFHAVLGGLGQFGIITKARIDLEPAPQRVKWIRVLYSDFDAFIRDQEFLIKGNGSSATFDYVEGFVIVNNEGLLSNWRSSFFSPQNPVKLDSLSLDTKGKPLYCIEMTLNYNTSSSPSVDSLVESLLQPLSFIPSTVFTTDTSYVEFLDRVHRSELKLRSKGLWDVPHPWLNLLIPRKKIQEFGNGVFQGILRNTSSGPILVYPMNRNRWDSRTSAVTPDDDIFYLVALLRSAMPSSANTLDTLVQENHQILRFCRENGIGEKQYLAHYSTEAEWKNHFGSKWKQFVERKRRYDPNAILSPGQMIFPANNRPLHERH